MIVYDLLGRVIRNSESAGVREFVAVGISAGIQAAFDRCEVVGRKDLSRWKFRKSSSAAGTTAHHK